MDHEHGGDDETNESCPMIMTVKLEWIQSNKICFINKMYLQFHTGNCESILFKGIKVTNAEEFGVAVVVIFVIAIAYEGLRFWREKLHNDYTNQNASSCSNSKDGASANRKTIRYTQQNC